MRPFALASTGGRAGRRQRMDSAAAPLPFAHAARPIG